MTFTVLYDTPMQLHFHNDTAAVTSVCKYSTEHLNINTAFCLLVRITALSPCSLFSPNYLHYFTPNTLLRCSPYGLDIGWGTQQVICVVIFRFSNPTESYCTSTNVELEREGSGCCWRDISIWSLLVRLLIMGESWHNSDQMIAYLAPRPLRPDPDMAAGTSPIGP
jgi:hypothetical protein